MARRSRRKRNQVNFADMSSLVDFIATRAVAFTQLLANTYRWYTIRWYLFIYFIYLNIFIQGIHIQ